MTLTHIEQPIKLLSAYADILNISGQWVQVLLEDGTEARWPLGYLVEQLQGVERLLLTVVDGDLEVTPVLPTMVPA